MAIADNDDLKEEGIEITGSARVNPDAEVELAEVAPVLDEDTLATVDDELEGEKLDIPYVDEDKGFL